MQTKPSHAIQLIFPSVRMLANNSPTMAATATKTAVHAPWAEMAFRLIEMPSIPDPPQKSNL